MHLSKRQRAQVVELLRCAADVVLDTPLPISQAQYWLDAPDEIKDMAIAARYAITGDHCYDDERYRAEILEAALRVEQGEWP